MIDQANKLLKPYVMYGQPKSASEVRDFLVNFEKEVTKPEDRHMKILPHIPTGTDVLDYGCGWGIFTRMVHRLGCRVTGIDLDPNCIKIARDITGEETGLTFVNQTIANIPDASFDVVISNQVIEHVHNPGNYLQECNRVLRPGGHLIIATPNVVNPQFVYYQLSPKPQKEFQRISNVTKSQYSKTHDHILGWDPYSFCRLLCSMGFEYVAHEYMEGVPFPGPHIWHTQIPLIRNLCYTMLFKVQKYTYIELGSHD